jgi:hypothetical protein
LSEHSVLAPVRSTFRSVARCVVPEAGDLDEAAWAELEGIVEHALSTRPARMQRQLRMLLRAIAVLPLARYGRTFAQLDPAQRATFLGKLQDARVLLLRRGFWGLRTLILMGYYARPSARSKIGYRADCRGWAARV